MAALSTLSEFTYGHNITENNRFINFSDDAGLTESTATIAVGSYTLGEFVNAIATALNDATSVIEFTVSLDRATRLITINADGNFDLLIATGSNSAQSAFSLIGFTGADLTGLSTYEGDSASGFVYRPQFRLQNFVDFEDDLEIVESAVKVSGSGTNVEVVSYGEVNFMQSNITYITDIAQPADAPIESNLSGVADFRAFRDYIIRKRPIEFIVDRDDPNTFTKCLLERTPESRDGTALRLKELSFSGGPAFYFQSGLLRFRELS